MSKDVVKFDELDVSKIVFRKLEDNPRIPALKIGYIYYKFPDGEKPLKIQTPEIDLETYGIPREGPFYDETKKRAKIKVPFCFDRHLVKEINYDKIKIFYEKLIEIDTLCASAEHKELTFGQTANQYEYSPIIRLPDPAIDEHGKPILDKNGNEVYRPPYTVFKLDLVFDEESHETTDKPNFTVFVKNGESKKKAILEQFEQATEIIGYRSKIKCIVSFAKRYAMKNKKGNGKNEKKTYGLTLKATHIEVKPSTFSHKNNPEEDPFGDSDDENENKQTIKRQPLSDLNSEQQINEVSELDKNLNQLHTSDLIKSEVKPEVTQEIVIEEIVNEPSEDPKGKKKETKTTGTKKTK